MDSCGAGVCAVLVGGGGKCGKPFGAPNNSMGTLPMWSYDEFVVKNVGGHEYFSLPAKIKLLIFLVSKILFLLMERCTIRVLMLMQCNSPKGCRRFQGFSSISTSILA